MDSIVGLTRVVHQYELKVSGRWGLKVIPSLEFKFIENFAVRNIETKYFIMIFTYIE